MKRRFSTALIALEIILAAGCHVTRVTVEGQSMSPTFGEGQRVVATRMFTALHRGDIIAMEYPRDRSRSFCNRIIGLPGEVLEIRDGRVFINQHEIDEPYVPDELRSHETTDPQTIPPDEYFVMGDHRNNSSDSRVWGTVPKQLIWARLRLPAGRLRGARE